MEEIPAQCPKSANPYTYCPFVFKHENEMILSMVDLLIRDARRARPEELARLADDRTRELTAYMNGRIHGVMEAIKSFSGGEE
jgi:hypothetical protein